MDTHTLVCSCVQWLVRVMCVWLVDSCFQLKLYAGCILLHKQDMHLVVSTQILQRPCECVTLSFVRQAHLAHLTETPVETRNARLILLVEFTYVWGHYNNNNYLRSFSKKQLDFSFRFLMENHLSSKWCLQFWQLWFFSFISNKSHFHLVCHVQLTFCSALALVFVHGLIISLHFLWYLSDPDMINTFWQAFEFC